MTMTRDGYRTTIRRRPDGLVQIQVLPLHVLEPRKLLRLGLGALGVGLLMASVLATPFWLAWNARPSNAGRARPTPGATVTELGGHRR